VCGDDDDSDVDDSPGKPPVLHLTGDTRACHGRFDVTAGHLSWTSTWSRCSPRPVHVIASDAFSWTFEIVPSKTCPFAVVQAVNVSKREDLPTGEYPLYDVSGYETMAAFREHRDPPRLSCNMQ
jgi:hypothetical protein